MSLDKVAAQFIQQPLAVLQGKLSQSKPEAKVTAFCNAVESLANSLVDNFQRLHLLSEQLTNLFVSPTQESFASMVEALQVIDNRFSRPNLGYRNADDLNTANANHVESITGFRAARTQLLTAGAALFNS